MNTKPSSLPTSLLAALFDLGTKLESNDGFRAELDTVLDLLARLSPSQVVKADRDIAPASRLYHSPQPSLIHRILFPRPSWTEHLLRTPGLEYVFLFHYDGRVRESALLKISGGLPNPFFFAAVAWRLNDWAEPVRRAAATCARRTFPLTLPSVVASTAADLVVRLASWDRWRGERAILDDTFSRDDVAAELAVLIAREATGPQASILRYALRTPALDKCLERIANDAMQPSVRALALETLINGRAQWASGTDWQWVDKSMGLRRRVKTYDHRPLTIAPPCEALIAQGVKDRSATVRRVALTGVITHLLGASEARAFASRLATDRSPSVRERAQFILRSEATNEV